MLSLRSGKTTIKKKTEMKFKNLTLRANHVIMKFSRKLYLLSLFSLIQLPVCAQTSRINTTNSIGWFNYFGTIKISSRFSLHTEYQWRRDDYIINWQQSLLRTGINYQAGKQVLLRAGYGWIETFAYGDIPLNAAGRDFTEHRIYEMVQLSSAVGRTEWNHRWMLEQRWVGKYNGPDSDKEDEFPLLHRLRYMARVQLPLKGQTMADHTPYLALYDEIFIGFGENVNANVFDQNRLGILFGYKLNQHIRAEGGYLQQIVQYGRQINGKNIFQYNHGLIINLLFNLDVSKKAP